VSGVAHLLLWTAPPVTSGDVFHYALFGRMVNGTALDPYLTPGAALVGDPLLRYASWPELASHYGPAFTWLSALAARAGGDGVLGTALAMKAVMVLCNLGACLLVWRLAVDLYGGDGAWALAAYAWNPVVLLETAAFGHNDAVMLALALLGLWLYRRGRPWLGFAALVVSADIKLVTGVVTLFMAGHFVAAGQGRWARIGRGLGLAAVTAGVLLVLWLPFWEGGRAFVAAHEVLFVGGPRVTGAMVGPLRVPLALGSLVLVIGGVYLAARAPFERVIHLAAVASLCLVVIFPWRWSWYALSPLALAAIGARTRPRLMLFAIAALWGGTLMLRYSVAHSPLTGP
jgi:hypothetical protein